jgi:hypothetical protein
MIFEDDGTCALTNLDYDEHPRYEYFYDYCTWEFNFITVEITWHLPEPIYLLKDYDQEG